MTEHKHCPCMCMLCTKFPNAVCVYLSESVRESEEITRSHGKVALVIYIVFDFLNLTVT